MEKDRKVIIATHGELAKGFLSALHIIVGESVDVDIICGYTNINLAFLVDLILTTSCIDEKAINQKVAEDLVGIKYVNAIINSFDEDLDDSL